MKDELTLIHKIWSDLKEKKCCRRIVNVEREKWRNGNSRDEVFMNEVRRGGEREGRESEKEMS
jgi:hypothetical protein